MKIRSRIALQTPAARLLRAVVLMALGSAVAPIPAAQPMVDLVAIGAPVGPGQADPAITQAIGRISAERIRRTMRTLVGFGTRHTLSSMAQDLPPGQGVNAAAAWIEAELERYAAACGGCLSIRRDTFTESVQERIPRPTKITNVYALLQGSDAAPIRRVYLVTAHYDSRITDVLDDHGAAPGANDDASGVAVSLECARVLSVLKPTATIVFAVVAGEEQGLNGSRHLARLAKSSGWALQGVLDNDIVGGNTTPGDRLQNKSLLRVFSEGVAAAAAPDQVQRILALGYESDSPSRELARAVLDVAATYSRAIGALGATEPPAAVFQPILEFRRDRFLRGGDHAAFNQEGFPAVRFTEWREDFNHQHQNLRREQGVEYGDLLKFVDFDYVARVTAVNAAVLAALAAGPAAPVNARILTTDLDNKTTLVWERGPGTAAGTHYEILWRALAAPAWERSADAGEFPAAGRGAGEEGATLPISKDNVIFGIRAVDASGHRGAAVVPWPQK